MKKIKNILNCSILLASLALIGCGGGGGSGETTPLKSSAVVLQTLSNSQGISRITGEKTGLIYSPQISAVTQAMNQSFQNNDSSGVGGIDPRNFPVISTTASTTTRRGTITSDGTTLNVTTLTNNNTSNAGGVYVEIPGDADMLMVIGDNLTSAPSSGSVTYTGVMTQNSRSVIAPGQLGSFTLAIDYSSKTFTIRGATSSMAVSGNGVVDTNTGLYASSVISVGVNGVSYTASLYGNLNGSGANSVSGIFYTNDVIPDYAGSFIGSR